LINGGIQKSCENNSGGVSKIFIADFPLVSGYTENAGEITSIVMSGSAKFYEFEFNRNTSMYKEDITIDLANGTTYFSQEVQLILARREKTKREAIQKLISGQKQLFVIVKDSNQLYWAFGKDEGVYLTALTGGSGVNKGDQNGYSITLTAQEHTAAVEVDSAIVPGLL
jgi:hypothetical protein